MKEVTSVISEIMSVLLKVCYGSVRMWPSLIRLNRRDGSYAVTSYKSTNDSEAWHFYGISDTLDVTPALQQQMLAKAHGIEMLRNSKRWLDVLEIDDLPQGVHDVTRFDVLSVNPDGGLSARLFAKMNADHGVRRCPAALSASDMERFEAQTKELLQDREMRLLKLFLDLFAECGLTDVLNQNLRDKSGRMDSAITDCRDWNDPSIVLVASPEGRCGVFVG